MSQEKLVKSASKKNCFALIDIKENKPFVLLVTSKQKIILLSIAFFIFLFFCSNAFSFSLEPDVSFENLSCPASVKENSTARISVSFRNWSWLEADATAFISLENATVKSGSLKSSFHHTIYSNKSKLVSNDIISNFFATQPFIIADSAFSGFGSRKTLSFQVKPIKNADSIKIFVHINTKSNSSPNYGFEYSQFGFLSSVCEIKILKNKKK